MFGLLAHRAGVFSLQPVQTAAPPTPAAPSRLPQRAARQVQQEAEQESEEEVEEEEQEERYDVERIMAVKGTGRNKRYLIK